MRKPYFILLTVLLIAYGCATPKMTQVPETMVLKEPPKFEVPAPKPEPQKAEELPAPKEAATVLTQPERCRHQGHLSPAVTGQRSEYHR